MTKQPFKTRSSVVGVFIVSHELEDGMRIIPSPSVARLLGRPDRRSVQDILAAAFVTRQARNLFLAAEQEFLPVSSSAIERGFSTDARTDLVIEIAYSRPDHLTERWPFEIRDRAEKVSIAFISAEPGTATDSGVRH
jgi:hypothetical protein